MKSPRASAPLYQQVGQSIEQLIEAGTLRPGERLPSVRRASVQHQVSLTTAVQAYLWLENRGLIAARPKSGFYVRPRFPALVAEPPSSSPPRAANVVEVASLQSRLFDAARHPEIVPLGAAYPGTENLPVAKLSRIMAAVTRSAGPKGLAYDMPPGSAALRREIAKRALDRGLQLSADEIITTSGGTEALALCIRAVTKPGDVIAVESPTYFGLLQCIEQLRLKALEIPMHPRDGMDLDALERAVKTRRVAACVAVPNFSNPLGSLMPEANKQRLVEILRRREIPLIEDDINGGLYHSGDRPRVVKSYDRAGLVMLCGSFSKTLAPGYRVGWVLPGRFYEKVHALKLTSTLATASLPQMAIAEFMANGGYDHHLRALRRSFAAQLAQTRDAVMAAFPAGIRLTRPAGGFVLWVELPGHVSALDLHQRALAQQISVAPGPMFSATRGFKNYVRINCGHPWSPRIEQAVGILGKLVRELASA